LGFWKGKSQLAGLRRSRAAAIPAETPRSLGELWRVVKGSEGRGRDPQVLQKGQPQHQPLVRVVLA